MPKNKGRGGKNYKRGKHSAPTKRDLPYASAEELTVYGVAEKMLGNGRVLVKCFDQVQRIGNIRGKMKRKVWIAIGDLLLCSLREQNEKCDIIVKYTPDQVRQLKSEKKVPQDLQIRERDGPSDNGEVEFINEQDRGDGSDQDDDSDSESSSSDSSSNDSDDGPIFNAANLKEKMGKINIDDI